MPAFANLRGFIVAALVVALHLPAAAQEAPASAQAKPPAAGEKPAAAPGGGADAAGDEKTEEQKKKPEEPRYTREYINTLDVANRHFHARQFDKALLAVDAADKIIPDTVPALNIRGAIAIEQRKFDLGAEYCNRVLKLDPGYFPAKYNLGEIPFLQKNFAEARKIFSKLLTEDPNNELLQYRIFLTHLLEDNKDAARRALDAMKFPSDSGAYYYAHAAWEFANGNKEEALKWVQSGDWIFSPARNIYFADVLYDLGWMQRPANGTNE